VMAMQRRRALVSWVRSLHEKYVSAD